MMIIIIIIIIIIIKTGKSILIQMLNLAVDSASICLETMRKNSCKFKCLALNLNVMIHTSNRATCLHGKIIIE